MAEKPRLTPEQQERLRKLEATIQHEKITVGFSIEGRDAQNRKKWALFSATVGRKDGEGWSTKDAQIVACLLSKQVVVATYRDALRRKILSREEAQVEAKAIIESYNANLANLLKDGS